MKVVNEWGALVWRDDVVEVGLQRRLEHPRERVWAMLTESSELAQWLAPGTLEGGQGGRARIDFGNSGRPIDSIIREWRPPARLAYSWSAGSEAERPLRWHLAECGDTRTDLSLTLTLPDDDLLAIACAGWDAHLEMLAAALEGIAIHFPRDRFQQARSAFSAMHTLALAPRATAKADG